MEGTETNSKPKPNQTKHPNSISPWINCVFCHITVPGNKFCAHPRYSVSQPGLSLPWVASQRSQESENFHMWIYTWSQAQGAMAHPRILTSIFGSSVSLPPLCAGAWKCLSRPSSFWEKNERKENFWRAILCFENLPVFETCAQRQQTKQQQQNQSKTSKQTKPKFSVTLSRFGYPHLKSDWV